MPYLLTPQIYDNAIIRPPGRKVKLFFAKEKEKERRPPTKLTAAAP